MLPNPKSTDPRVQRTRRWLQQSLQALLQEKEFSQITVQDITEKAGVNRATFYAHFEDKYALMNTFVLEQFQDVIDKRLSKDATLNHANLRLLILATCEFLQEFSGHCKPVLCNHHPPTEVIIQWRLYEVLLSWLQPTRNIGSYSIEIAARATAWAIFGSVWEWSRSRSGVSAAQYTDDILDFIAGGLVPSLAAQQGSL